MVTLEVTIQLNAPLFLGAQKQGNISETLTFLPGTVLRGATGKLLAQQCGHRPDAHSNCDFAVLFSEKIQPQFGPCYPSLSRFSYPFPATARQCKHYPGFKDKIKDKNDDTHGIHDILIPLFANEEAIEHSRENHQKIKAFRPECEICKAKLEPVSGFYEPSGLTYLHPQPRVMRLSRTAINRRRYVAADKLLYTLELISEQISGVPDPKGHAHPEPTKFRGRILAADEAQAALLEKILPMITHLGGATSRGLGSVAVRVEKPLRETPPEPENAAEELANAASKLDFNLKAPSGSLTNRLALFNQALTNAFKAYPDYNLSNPRLYFSVDCLSDVILLNGGLPTALLPEKFASARRVRSFSKPARLSGFSGATCLMRSPQLAIGRGSVFLYCLEPATSEVIKSTLTILHKSENEGLGQNKERGYGLVQICSPFHLEVNPI